MYRILDSKRLSEAVFEMTVEAPQIAKKAKAGQFFIVMINEKSERVPFTFSDWDAQKGWIRFTYAVVGKSTMELSALQAGDSLYALTGPLGNPTEVGPGKWAVIGGGAGIATTYPVARALCEAGAEVTVISGARSKGFLILQDELASLPIKRHIVMTDDGSEGMRGVVTEPLKELCEAGEIEKAFAVGPLSMMKYCCMTANQFELPIIVSLNPIMVDGTGMCGACRCKVDGETKFACIHGPDFPGNDIDWDGLVSRSKLYSDREKDAVIIYERRY